jgi:hypothetical protein
VQTEAGECQYDSIRPCLLIAFAAKRSNLFREVKVVSPLLYFTILPLLLNM